MKEQIVKIPSYTDNIAIHGTLRGDYEQPLAILAPGLGGWMHDLLLFNASRHFGEQGIATLRLSFYGHDSSQRNINDFDVKSNAADIDAAVEFAKQKGSPWVCVIGHSYSGMAIVYSERQEFDAAVLWDPSHTDGYDDPQSKRNLENDFMYVKELDAYVSGTGPGYVLSRKVFENYAPGSTEMARKFNVGTLIVNAAWSKEMQNYGTNYASNIPAPNEHIVIPDSTHPFTEDGAMERLFEATVNWMNKTRKNQTSQRTLK